MIPSKTNTDNGCSPVSSNCVIWQGPNISCINLCTGDSVSEVVYKLGLELCAIKDQLNLTDLDFSCLVSSAVGTPEPEHTLAVALELLITKVCTLDEILNAAESGNGSVNLDFAVTIPSDAACFKVPDENGDPITQISHSLFTKAIARKVCALVSTSAQHTSTLNNHETRIVSLETATSTNDETVVTPACVLTPGTPAPVSEVLEALEQEFCNLKAITGTSTALSASLTYQCQGLGGESALSFNGTMSSSPGWRSPVSTVADALTNMFITICDMRAALKDVVLNGGSSLPTTFNCSSIIVDFTIVLNEARDTATVLFAGLTNIPDGVLDCTTQGAKVTFSDSNGGKYITYINVNANKANTAGVTVTLTGLNPALNYSVTLEGCFEKDGTQCSKVVTKEVPMTCAVVTGVTATFI